MPLGYYRGRTMRGRLVRLDKPAAAAKREALEDRIRRELAAGPRTLAELAGISAATRDTILALLRKWVAAGEVGEEVTYEKRTGPAGRRRTYKIRRWAYRP